MVEDGHKWGKELFFVLQVGSQIVYGIHGVCSIIDVEIRTVDRKKVEYFVLAPNDQPSARFYVPMRNELALSKLRPLLTKAELEDLLCANTESCNCWIADENRRKQKYRELLSSGDRAALISMMRALNQHREAQLAAGRKFHLCDENFLRDAGKVLCSEISLVLGIPHNEVSDYLKKKLYG